MTVGNRQFGQLLSEGVSSVARRQRKSMSAVEDELAALLGFSSHTIEYWRRGHLPADEELVAALVRFCAEKGRVNREWAATILHHARYRGADSLLPGVFLLAFSPDGSRLMTSLTRRDEIVLWDLATGEPLFSIDEPRNLTAVAISPDGSRIATGHQDSTSISIRDAATGAVLFELHGHQGRSFSVDFSPDGRYLVSGSADGSARVWDVTPGGRGELLSLAGSDFQGIGYHHQTSLLAAGSGDGTIWVWNVETGERVQHLVGHEGEGRGGSVWDAEIHPDGTLIASAGADSTARLWDLETGEELLLLAASDPQAKLVGYSFPGLLEVQFSPDGQWLATGGADGVVAVWDLHASLAEGEGQLLWSAESGVDGIWRLFFSEDGEWLVASVDASVSTIDANELRSATVVVWDARTGERLQTLTSPSEFRIQGLALSPDRAFIATSHTDNASFDLWRVE